MFNETFKLLTCEENIFHETCLSLFVLHLYFVSFALRMSTKDKSGSKTSEKNGLNTLSSRLNTRREWAGTWWQPGISPPSSSCSGIRNTPLLEFCVCKRSCPFIYSEYTMKMEQAFSPIQYIQNLDRLFNVFPIYKK